MKVISQSVIEARKDKFDLRPALEFVARHRARYEAGVRALMSVESQPVRNWSSLPFTDIRTLEDAGVNLGQHDIVEVVSRLPEVFQNLSQLTTMDCSAAAQVPVPVFEPDGTWKGKVEMVDEDTFPLKGMHPTRILIGRSTGSTIFPTALPKSVYGGVRERWLYQLHVFLHEFFHSMEYLRRDRMTRRDVQLELDGAPFTLDDWWMRWEQAFTAKNQPKPPTRYAGLYIGDLNAETYEKRPDVFVHTLAEQVCESFVGYLLGIVPNDEDSPDFKAHSPQLWALMDQLARSTFISG